MTQDELDALVKAIAGPIAKVITQPLEKLTASIEALEQRIAALEPIAVQGTAEDWGGAPPSSIRAVCLSVTNCFSSAVVERPVESIRVEMSEHGPKAVCQRVPETRQFRVLLSVQGPKWNQVAYQFAHEFFHVLTNTPHVERRLDATGWFEEALAETCSLFALRSMADTWRHAPPYRNWSDYAEHLAQYANDRLTASHAGYPVGVPFAEWLAGVIPVLEQDRYQRQYNNVVAHRLLPIFEADPGAWRAVRYLNLWSLDDDVRSASLFMTWRAVAPVAVHSAINRIEQALVGPETV